MLPFSADPNAGISADALLNRAEAAFHSAQVEACLDALDRLRALPDLEAKHWQAIAARYRALHHAEDAIKAYKQAARLTPKAIAPRADLAHYLQILGRFDEAETLYRRLIKSHPNQPELYRMFLGTKRLNKGDPLIRQMQKLWSHPRLNDFGRMHLGFALGKAAEESGGRPFAYLHAANQAQSRLAPFDRSARQAEFEAYLAAQNGADLAPLPGDVSLRPVFICGMPRSGTSLVEQIIARHSEASAGGELSHALRLAVSRFGKGNAIAPLDSLSPQALHAYADEYLKLASRDCRRTSGVITDKSILSYQIFGLIHRAMPGARLIVVHRDPRDIALSIYKNHFALGTHRYANDLGDIAFAIKAFRRAIAYWRERLPGQVFEIHYEDLVRDPAQNARALIGAAGLDWQEACLESHKAAGPVQTLSLMQVRQPIHAGRPAAWKNYEAQLEPFIRAWGDEPWE